MWWNRSLSTLLSTTLRVLRNCELGCSRWRDAVVLPTNESRRYECQFISEVIPVARDESGVRAWIWTMTLKSGGVFYGTFDSHKLKIRPATPSFVTATSTPCMPELPELASVTAGTPWTDFRFQIPNRNIVKPSVSPPTVLHESDFAGPSWLQRLTDRGLMQLTDLRRLEWQSSTIAAALWWTWSLALSFHRLHTLSLANCRRLRLMRPSLTSRISFAGGVVARWLSLCDRSLAAVADLYALRKLDLSQCVICISDGGLGAVGKLGCLEELSLGWCRQITDQGIDILSAQPERSTTLRILRLARCPISQGVEYLGRLVALEELDLNGCSSVGGITALGKTLESLTHLKLGCVVLPRNLVSMCTFSCSWFLSLIASISFDEWRSGWQGRSLPEIVGTMLLFKCEDVHISKLTFHPLS
jgi:hypothetical protein